MRSAIELTTAGESHGPAVVAIVEGIPAGLPIAAAEIDADLARRQGGYGRGARMAIERDRAQLTAGVRHGRTLGSPICLVVANRDWENWAEEMGPQAPPRGWASERGVSVPRPGHADLAGGAKFGHADLRNVLERASARETAARVAGGAVCRKLLSLLGGVVRSRTVAIGGACDEAFDGSAESWARIEASDVRCSDDQAAAAMRERIDAARDAGDSVGGVIEVVAEGLPPGLGSCATWGQRLDARIGQAMLSIPAIKAVEIGAGMAAASLPGSQVHDAILPGGGDGRPFARASNNAGGIEGGMTNGEPVIVRVAMKPIPTLTSPLPSVDVSTGEPAPAHAERSDVCAVPAAGVVGEAMLALVLASAVVEKFGGDCVSDMLAAFEHYRERLALPWQERQAQDDGS